MIRIMTIASLDLNNKLNLMFYVLEDFVKNVTDQKFVVQFYCLSINTSVAVTIILWK